MRSFQDRLALILCHRLGNNRNKTCRKGCRNNSRHIHESCRHTCQIAKKRGRLFHGKSCHGQAAGHDEKINTRYNRKHNIGQRNGDCQYQKALQNRSDTKRLYMRILPGCQFSPPALCHKIAGNKYKDTDKGTGCRTKSSTSRTVFQTVRHEHNGKSNHCDNTNKLFDNLRNSGRRHHLETLEIPAERCQKRSTKYRRR